MANIIKKMEDAELSTIHTFNLNGVEIKDTLDFTKVNNAGLRMETEKLQRAQADFVRSAYKTAKSEYEIGKERASALYRVKAEKQYSPDFDSLKDYIESIGLYMGKSGLSQTCTAGRVYIDKKAPDTLKNLPISVLGAMGGVINNDETRAQLYKDAGTDALPIPITQEAAKAYNKAHSKTGRNSDVNTTQGEITATYTATDENGDFDLCPPESDNHSNAGYTMAEYKEKFAADGVEVIELPDKDDCKRILVIDANDALKLYKLRLYNAEEAEARAKAEKEKAQTAINAIAMKLFAGQELTEDEKRMAEVFKKSFQN